MKVHLATDNFTARTALAALMASGLALSLGCHPAAADDELGAPQIQTVRVDGGVAYITFVDNASIETNFNIELRDRAHPDKLIGDRAYDSPGAPGTGRVVTRQVSRVPDGVAVCATVRADHLGGTGALDDISSSPMSYAVCTDPAAAEKAQDLALPTVRGKEEQQWNLIQGKQVAYIVEARNPGGADATGATIDIATDGVATLGDQNQDPNHSKLPFTCVNRAPSGGETAALSCTGVSIPKGQSNGLAVIVIFTGPGIGGIYASISVPGDTNAANNGTRLSIRVL